jgi:hypothetical protein
MNCANCKHWGRNSEPIRNHAKPNLVCLRINDRRSANDAFLTVGIGFDEPESPHLHTTADFCCSLWEQVEK